MDTLYNEILGNDQPVKQSVRQIQALCSIHGEEALIRVKTMRELTATSPNNTQLAREIKAQIVWNLAVKANFSDSSTFYDGELCDWAICLLQRLALVSPNKNSWKFFLNDELVPEFHEQLGLFMFRLISGLGLEPPALLAEYNACNTTGASSADLNMSHFNDSVHEEEGETVVVEKTPEKVKPALTRSISSRAMFSDPNIEMLCNMSSKKPPVLNATKEFQKADPKPNPALLFMPMTNRTKLTQSDKRKAKSPRTKTPSSRKSPSASRSTKKKTPQSNRGNGKTEDKISTTPKRKSRTTKNSTSGKEKTPASVKMKKILETPNPDKYKPRWERAIDAALKKTDKEYKIAESPMKPVPTSPLTSPIRRLRSIPSRSFCWSVQSQGDTNSNLQTPILNFNEASQSSLSQSAFSSTMNKAELWRRNQMLEELSLSKFDCFDNSLNTTTCDTLNLSSANGILTKKSQRRKSNLFDMLAPKEQEPEKCDIKPQGVFNIPKTLLTPSKLTKISSPNKSIQNSVKFDPFKSPIKSSLKSPIKSPGAQKRVSISNFHSKHYFSPKQKIEKSSLDSSVITPLNFNEKIIASSPLLTRPQLEPKVNIESPKLFGTSPENKENLRPTVKKRGRPNSKINKALLKSAISSKTSYKNPDLRMPSDGISFASFDEGAMFLDKEQFFKKQTDSVYNVSMGSSEFRTPLQTPLKPDETPSMRKRIRPDSDTNDSVLCTENSNMDSSSSWSKPKRSKIDPRLSPKPEGNNFISRSTRRSQAGLSDETPKIYSITPHVFEKQDESNTQSSNSRNRHLRHSQIFGDTFDSLDTINNFNEDSSLLSSDNHKVQLPYVPIFQTNPIIEKEFESPRKKRKKSGTGARRALFKQA